MLIAASAILLVLGLLAYRRPLAGQARNTKDKGQGRPKGAELADLGLLVLRLAILLLFAAVFIGAVFTRVWVERPRRVAVMLDVSQSMGAIGAESAAAAAAEALPLPNNTARQEWLFGDTAKGISDFRLKIADSQTTRRTRIGAALKTVGKTRPGAVVLLSDGQDNGETDAAAAAHDIGVPVYTVGFGGLAKRNASVEQVLLLPAVVYSGETADVQVRVSAAGFANEKARVRFRGETKEVVLGQAPAEQDVPFRLVIDKPGRQVVEAQIDSLMGESNYSDNTRSAVVDVRPSRVRVAYVTNRPTTETRMMLRALTGDERIAVESLVAISGDAIGKRGQPPRGTMNAAAADVFILDDVVESGSPDVWQSIADRVQSGAGILVLAGPDFQPGPIISRVINGTIGPAQAGSFTPELTAEGRVLPWFIAGSIDFTRVPPFVGVKPVGIANRRSPAANRTALGYNSNSSAESNHIPRPTVWLASQENNLPLMVAEKAGTGKVVYVAGYPMWRWGFGPEQTPGQGTALSDLVSGVVRYLAEHDTSPFRLQTDKTDLHHGEPVRLVMRAVAPDGRPWTRLSVVVRVSADSADSSTRTKSEVSGQNAEGRSRELPVPMTETGAGMYEATFEALEPGRYNAVAAISLSDTALGKARTEFVVAEQAVELANTGMNEGLLRSVSDASGGRFFSSDSLPRGGNEITLGSYRRRLSFDPRRAAWAYVLIALLAGAEWLLRRRRGML
ncbi:MAG TPA: hypothetical protein VMH22_02220 [bacterium]|nr:hypothetical protein [bacterium]